MEGLFFFIIPAFPCNNVFFEKNLNTKGDLLRD